MESRAVVDAIAVLRAVVEASERRNRQVPLGGGLTVHVIERAEAVGPGRELTGTLLVEAPGGSFHRITGRELAEFAERNLWVKPWRLESDDWTRRGDDDEGEDGGR